MNRLLVPALLLAAVALFATLFARGMTSAMGFDAQRTAVTSATPAPAAIVTSAAPATAAASIARPAQPVTVEPAATAATSIAPPTAERSVMPAAAPVQAETPVRTAAPLPRAPTRPATTPVVATAPSRDEQRVAQCRSLVLYEAELNDMARRPVDAARGAWIREQLGVARERRRELTCA